MKDLNTDVPHNITDDDPYRLYIMGDVISVTTTPNIILVLSCSSRLVYSLVQELGGCSQWR
jgi:hypothetical protein